MAEIISINPVDGTALETFRAHELSEVDEILEQCHEEFLSWRQSSFEARGALMRKAADVLRRNRDRYARTMTLEMGKPVEQSGAEIEKCAWVCEYYAEHAQGFLDVEEAATDASKSYVRFDPIGAVLAVMPWNFPFWQVFRFAAPALMAGNVGVLKHASNVPRCALQIEEVFREAGFPENTFRTLLIGSSLVDHVIAHPRIAAVTLTGSDAAGRSVARTAGQQLKKTVLELGGSDPFIVLEDADIEAAARTAVAARVINTGQSCIAAKRFIVVESVADAFERLFIGEMERKRVGDPLDPDTEIGPLARKDLVEELHDQVFRSVQAGATILLGGKPIPGPGAYYEPTVLGNVQPGMPAFDEELFGPVAPIVRAVDEHDAIAIANDSVFGLGASLWTGNQARAERLAAMIESGCVFVNGMVKSDPRLPFGGVKTSGYGRELSSYGIKEFTNIKSVWIK